MFDAVKAAAVAAAVLVVGLVTGEQHTGLATHAPAGVYRGAHEAAGSITVTVSADSITATLQAQAVPVDPFLCPGETVNISLSNIPILTQLLGHFFQQSSLVGSTAVLVQGDFSKPAFVTGLIYVEKPGTDCSNFLTFAATTEPLPDPLPIGPQPEATYSGPRDDGGEVSMVVTADGLALSFDASNVPVDPFACAGQSVNVSVSNIPIQTVFGSPYFQQSTLVGDVVVNVDGFFDIPGFVTGIIDLEKSGGSCFNFLDYVAVIQPTLLGDTDGDTWSDAAEAVIGTNPLAACGVNAWPADMNNDRFSDISDVVALAGSFNKAVPPAPARHNIAPNPLDGFVDITDVVRLAGFFNRGC
jgi:hypothetical protein